MAKKANNYFVKVAKYQKEHPRATRQHAMAMVSKAIAGPAKRKVAGPKKKRATTAHKPKRKSIIKTERITTIGAKRTKKTAPLSRGISISRRIDDLELLLKNTSGTTAKNHVKRMINAEHDKLDAITKHLKTA